MISTLDLPNGHACDAPYLADADFTLERPGARAMVERWYPVMVAIENAPGKVAAIAAAARQLGEKKGNVKALYYDHWQKSGRDWRSLIDRRKFPDPRNAKLPPQFEQFIRATYEAQKGRDQSGNQTYRQIMSRLAEWERDPHNPQLAIPGYDAPPARDPFLGHPPGWSLDSIMRRLPDRYERALRKQGPKAATQFLPDVLTTRVGLAVGQVIYFDDQVHDVYVNVTGINAKAMRPVSFNALDALTGYAFDPGLKPQLCDPVSGRVRTLDQLDFFWYVMMVLTRYGYNAETGTTLVFEHGTANVDKRDIATATDHFDVLIQGVTGGKVRVARSGIFHAPAFRGLLFEGKPTGNFRFKAPIESWFNLLRNYSAALPAPTGRNRDRAPEENYGLLLANDRQLQLIDKLPPERFMRLRREVLEWEDYAHEHRRIMRAINQRREHHLEGWHKLGFTGQQYRLGLDQPWIAEAQWQLIPAETRDVYRHIVTQPGYFQSFRLSPEEAHEQLRPQLTTLPMSKIPLLAPPRAWEPVTVTQKLEMHVRRELTDPDPLRYLARVRDPRGYVVHLERGKTYLRLLNIFDPSQLWIAEADGSRKGTFIGVADLLERSCKVDEEGLQAQMGAVASIRAIESQEAGVRAEPEIAARLAMREHNRRVTEGEPTTAEEIAEARSAERRLQTAMQLGAALRDEVFASDRAPVAPEPAAEVEDLTPPDHPTPQPTTTDIEKW